LTQTNNNNNNNNNNSSLLELICHGLMTAAHGMKHAKA
jgi:hypothetical protein